MPQKTYRITNAQRAGFCGLMIAGLKYADACAVVDVSQQLILDVIPDRWLAGPPPARRYKSWKGERLEQIRLAYADTSQNARDIADRFNMPLTYLYRLVRIHDWPRRVHKGRMPGERLIDNLTKDQLRIYHKLRNGGLGRPAAYDESLR